MVFNSLTFAVFFAIVFGLYQLPISWRSKKIMLLAASYLFYAAWNPPFILILWGSTWLDYYLGRRMERTEGREARRALLVVSLITNLGLLSFFKYGSFLLDNFVAAMAMVGVVYQPPAFDIILPIGISFYTFMSLSYVIDVYRKESPACHSPLDFCLYVTFFPHLVAGPIVRATKLIAQFETPKRPTNDQLSWGLALLTIGLFQKVILADAITAPVADLVFGSADKVGFASAWIGTLAFATQIFCDFAGYSTCAIGISLCLGFTLTTNFRYPYAAVGFSDFWRRWHISLSTWLRDYLYIPLGGNRATLRRTYVNLMITMLLGGLWHGASWRFVVWGGLHGAYLAIERWLKEHVAAPRWLSSGIGRFGLAMFTFVLVCFTWVFFRATDFESAFQIVTAMVGLADTDQLSIGAMDRLLVLGVTGGLLIWQWFMRDRTIESVFERASWWGRSLALVPQLLALFLVQGDNRSFIYFQF